MLKTCTGQKCAAYLYQQNEITMKKFNALQLSIILSGLELYRDGFHAEIEKVDGDGRTHLFTKQYVNTVVYDTLVHTLSNSSIKAVNANDEKVAELKETLNIC